MVYIHKFDDTLTCKPLILKFNMPMKCFYIKFLAMSKFAAVKFFLLKVVTVSKHQTVKAILKSVEISSNRGIKFAHFKYSATKDVTYSSK